MPSSEGDVSSNLSVTDRVFPISTVFIPRATCPPLIDNAPASRVQARQLHDINPFEQTLRELVSLQESASGHSQGDWTLQDISFQRYS